MQKIDEKIKAINEGEQKTTNGKFLSVSDTDWNNKAKQTIHEYKMVPEYTVLSDYFL